MDRDRELRGPPVLPLGGRGALLRASTLNRGHCIGVHGLHNVLAIVERPLDRDVVDVGVGERVHLRPLEGAHAPARREHEDVDPVEPLQRVLGGRPGVAARGPEHIEPPVLPLGDALVTREREMIEAALAETRGKVAGRSGAAARLGLPPSTLESKIRALKISKDQYKRP